MSDRLYFRLAHPAARQNAIKAIQQAPDMWRVEIKPPRRSDAQSDLMWGLLTDLAKQVEWHGRKLTKEDWKEMATAALKQQRVIPGINGGFVVLGARTSKMGVKEMTDVIEFVYAFGAERGVVFFTDRPLEAA